MCVRSVTQLIPLATLLPCMTASMKEAKGMQIWTVYARLRDTKRERERVVCNVAGVTEPGASESVLGFTVCVPCIQEAVSEGGQRVRGRGKARAEGEGGSAMDHRSNQLSAPRLPISSRSRAPSSSHLLSPKPSSLSLSLPPATTDCLPLSPSLPLSLPDEGS